LQARGYAGGGIGPRFDYTQGSMPWTMVAIEVDEAGAEIVQGLLAARGALLEVRDADTLEHPGPGRVEIRIYVSPAQAATEVESLRQLAADAAARSPVLGTVRLTTAELDDDSWRDAWKRFCVVQRVGRFLVRPSWDQVAPAPGERVIDLDPGRAFGTGTHASTRLCLRALERIEATGAQPRRFVDAGCGSGILAIAALRVWPQLTGVALDMDPEAVAVADENVRHNGLGDRLSLVARDAASLSGPVDLVLANIQREVLEVIAEEICGAMAPGGWVVLSGLLIEQAGPVADRYVEAGLDLVELIDEDEWRAVLLRRP